MRAQKRSKAIHSGRRAPGDGWLITQMSMKTGSPHKLKTLIVLATNWNETTRKASLVVPMAFTQNKTEPLNITDAQRVNRAKPLGGRKTLMACKYACAALDQNQAWVYVMDGSVCRCERTNLSKICPLNLGPWGTNPGSQQTKNGVFEANLLTMATTNPASRWFSNVAGNYGSRFLFSPCCFCCRCSWQGR